MSSYRYVLFISFVTLTAVYLLYRSTSSNAVQCSMFGIPRVPKSHTRKMQACPYSFVVGLLGPKSTKYQSTLLAGVAHTITEHKAVLQLTTTTAASTIPWYTSARYDTSARNPLGRGRRNVTLKGPEKSKDKGRS